VTIHDPAGRQVATVLDAWMPAGRRAATWNVRDGVGNVPAQGGYFARLSMDGAASGNGRIRRAKIMVLR
jgi:hypothetical protein